MSIENIRRLKEEAKLPKEKKVYRIPKKSEKKKLEEAVEKKSTGEDDTMKEKWFKNRRREMTGTCACGCGQKSQKYDDKHFRSSAAHIFPKSKFESVQYHHLNWVERAAFGGCHSVMDDTSMDRWPQMADWKDIKEKFFTLSTLLSDKERAKKFYHHLEYLVYKN